MNIRDYARLVTLLVGSFGVVVYIRVAWHLQRDYARLFLKPPVNGSDFDFIVVGAGSAGSVVAGRLAEVTGNRVLLIEAGGPSNYFQGVPAFLGQFFHTDYDWSYKVERSPHVGLSAKDKMLSMSGKVLGGTSAINWMLYFRGNPKDFDEWADLGNKGWSYKDVLPYFKKSQDFNGEVEDKEVYHGTGGRMSVEPASSRTPMGDHYDAALKELGYDLLDTNGKGTGEGFAKRIQYTVKNGWRMGTFRSFVEPLLEDSKADIEVVTFAEASKVLIQDGRAKGVRVERFGDTLDYMANKEVIVSAGAFGSPKLLLLSGVGPKDHLKEVGIDLVKDLPGVGKNLQDHVYVQYFVTTEDESLLTEPLNTVYPGPQLEFLQRGTGPLSEAGVILHGNINTPINKDTYGRPDAQLVGGSVGLDIDYGLGFRRMYDYQDEAFDFMYGRHLGKYRTSMLFPSIMRPKSRGEVRLRSPDYRDQAIIEGGLLSEKEDVDTLAEALKVAKKLVDTEVFKANGLRGAPKDDFFCGAFEEDTPEYLECHVRHWSFTAYHWSGSCSMGAVVDERLRVHGISGLRVADGSIMPRVVGANTNAAIIMIGEKAADMVLEDWRGKEGLQKEREENTGRKDEL